MEGPLRERSTGAAVRRAAAVTIVVVAIVAFALALWRLREVVILLFLALTLGAAMRPGVDWLERRLHVRRAIGVLLHYAVFAGLLALAAYLIVPTVLDQVRAALGGVPTSSSDLNQAAQHSTGIKHEVLLAIERQLQSLPSGRAVFHPAIAIGKSALNGVVATFFTLAAAAYWVLERDRVVELVASFAPQARRAALRDTWGLIDGKLGAYVRGQIVLVIFVAALLSAGFWAAGVPYWTLLGIFGGVVELLPVIGPLAAGALAVGAGLTVSWQVAVLAAVIVLVVRQVEDYVVVPRVLGGAVGLSPLAVLVSVFAVESLFGGLAVFLAIPLAAVVSTIVDVLTVRDELIPAEAREAVREVVEGPAT